MVINLGTQNSLVNQFIAELRDAGIQTDSMRFRKNMERLGEVFAYEISKRLEFESREITTSLGTANVPVLKYPPILGTILRAGLPLHQGLLNFFDHSDNAFVSAYREHRKDDEFAVRIEYTSCPDLEGKVLILSDPMLATGHSMLSSYKELVQQGKPVHTHLVAVLASLQGIAYLKRYMGSQDVTIWVGAIDDELTAQGYIVPGLGDAGDLAFGKKA
ncbi:MAG: uracil phosphoribosyltransferase [Bacteroidales bacterium]|nr:uracil phosphoribosyltransferase [Bacteroidales bacterium]MBK7173025.1 uracil phosphoribosyltransferase [Bacteroidales bacterium]